MRHRRSETVHPASRDLWILTLVALGSGGLTAAGCKKKATFDTSEPRHNLRILFQGAKAYYEKGAVVGPDGEVRPLQFPATTALVPATKCCKQKDRRCQPRGPGADGTTFAQSPSFRAVGFEIVDPHNYQYQLVSSGVGAGARLKIRAVADPKCDGRHIVLEKEVSVDRDMRVVGTPVTIRRGVTKLD